MHHAVPVKNSMRSRTLLSIGMAVGLGVALMAGAGCAGGSSAAPRTRTAQPTGISAPFVDFHVDSDDDLCWFVARADRPEGPFKKVFYQTTPLGSRVLRLSAPVGPSVYKVGFVNRVVVETIPISVEAVADKITPVAVLLTGAGSAQVQRDELGVHATVKGGIRTRRLEYGPDQSYRITLQPEATVPIQAVEQMPYAGITGK